MRKMEIWITAVMILTLLSGCASVQTTVITKTTTFYIQEYKNSGTIAVVAAEAAVNSSLEFAHYKKQFEQKLAVNGYTIVSNPSEAQYIGFVAYGIDNGKSSIVSTPIFGQTGGGTTLTFPPKDNPFFKRVRSGKEERGGSYHEEREIWRGADNPDTEGERGWGFITGDMP